jgi:hypothetical protein
MPAAKDTHEHELTDVVAFLMWGSPENPIYTFTAPRTFTRDSDLRSNERGVVRCAYRCVRRMLTSVRRIEQVHGYSRFDLAGLAIIAGDNELTWVARCMASVRTWLASNRAT